LPISGGHPVADESGRRPQYPLTADVSGVLAAACRERPDTLWRSHSGAGLPTRIGRMVIGAWVHHLVSRIEAEVAKLDRAGLLDDDPSRRPPMPTGVASVPDPLDSTAAIR
jgi:hypothetical protein